MMFALGAAGSLLDLVQSLTSSKSASGTAAAKPGQAKGNPFDLGLDTQAQNSGGSGSSGQGYGWTSISPQTMSALIDAQAQLGSTNAAPASRSDALKDLFSQIDGDGNGSIDKSEFENALGAGGTNLKAADDVFGKLDADGDGSVSIDEMTSALQGAGHHGHRHMHAAPSSLTTDLATGLADDTSTSDSNSDKPDSKSSDTNSTDPNSSTNPLHHFPLTLVPVPLTDVVRLDATNMVNAVFDVPLK